MSENYAHFRSEGELLAGIRLWQIVSPFLILFGTFGNVLTILVLSKPKFNNWSSTIYLLGLAVADICMLYVGLVRQWVRYTFDLDIRHTSVIICKLHWWLMYSTADCTVWILTTITFERVLSTLFPYKSKRLCSKNIAKIVLIVIVFSALAINSHLLYGFGRIELNIKNNTQAIIVTCAPLTDSYSRFFDNIWTWIDLCKFSLGPFVILSSGNACIIYRLVINDRKMKGEVQMASRGFKRTSNMSVLLLALNCMFIGFTLPISVYFIGAPYWIPSDIPRKVQLEDPWWALVNLLMYLNNSVNFILYCASGSRFRNHVKMLLFSFKRNQITPTGNLTINTVNNSTGFHM